MPANPLWCAVYAGQRIVRSHGLTMQRSIYNFGQILSDRIESKRNNSFCVFRAADSSAALFLFQFGALVECSDAAEANDVRPSGEVSRVRGPTAGYSTVPPPRSVRMCICEQTSFATTSIPATSPKASLSLVSVR